MNAEEQLLNIYRRFPCRALPNAYWKTASVLSPGDLLVCEDTAHRLISLAVAKEEQLLALWCSDRTSHGLSQEYIDRVPFALVHADCLSLFSHRNFSIRKAYFRLIQQNKAGVYELPPGYVFKSVHQVGELEEIVSLLRACYLGIEITKTTVRSWTLTPVYDPGLWVWVVDQSTGEKIGLGIADLDQRVPEASLEWIQIMPHFHNRGLGTALVEELLHRVNHRAAFTTVSGASDNPFNPERLYRKCGFTGSDVWWLLSGEG